MINAIRVEAPAKVNLVLQVGPRRGDGLHELCSLFASIELHDVVMVEPAGDVDAVLCPGVRGPNLAEAALEAFRSETQADLPPLRVTIEKRIPVAAGLGGGSADAAAVLCAANQLAGDLLDDDRLRQLGAALGSDVPSQIRPAHALVTGTGEKVELVELQAMWLVLVPSARGLATADVYAEADRLGTTRARLDPAALRKLAGQPAEAIAGALENDLQAAALALRPELEGTLAALTEAGALGTIVAGSGPTVFGVFGDPEGAEGAAAKIQGAMVSGLRS
ncbi:MAG: 4-(cytidine 5'-diphospho)-2-C-methyl-D-erythritol kinase [Thermoleophilaceae bacterium]